MLQVSVILVQPNLAQGPFHCLILERKWDISHYGLKTHLPERPQDDYVQCSGDTFKKWKKVMIHPNSWCTKSNLMLFSYWIYIITEMLNLQWMYETNIKNYSVWASPAGDESGVNHRLNVSLNIILMLLTVFSVKNLFFSFCHKRFIEDQDTIAIKTRAFQNHLKHDLKNQI